MSDEAMNNFTPRAQQVLALARKEADRFNHNFVGTEHLLLGLIKLGQGVAVNVLQKMGLDLETVRMEVEKQVGTGPDQKMIGNIPYTPRVKKVLALASKEAKALNHTYVGTEHILLGLLREGDGVAACVLKNLDCDIEQTRQEILKELDPNFAAQEEQQQAPGEPTEKQASGGPEKKGEVKTPALKAFGRDLTEIARKGEMDPVIGRKDEIERVIQILCRRTKNNPVLLGEAGVGKTAIVERMEKVLAQIIEHEENSRASLLEKKPKVVFNHIGRAYGVLANAHSISSKETMNLLSLLRLGVDLEMFPGVDRSLADELFISIQQAHLQKAYGDKLTAEERDLLRADILRERLQGVNRPVARIKGSPGGGLDKAAN